MPESPALHPSSDCGSRRSAPARCDLSPPPFERVLPRPPPCLALTKLLLPRDGRIRGPARFECSLQSKRSRLHNVAVRATRSRAPPCSAPPAAHLARATALPAGSPPLPPAVQVDTVLCL